MRVHLGLQVRFGGKEFLFFNWETAMIFGYTLLSGSNGKVDSFKEGATHSGPCGDRTGNLGVISTAF